MRDEPGPRLAFLPRHAPAVGSGHKFDGFLLTATLERHKNGQSADRDQILKLESCDYKDELNASWGRHL